MQLFLDSLRREKEYDGVKNALLKGHTSLMSGMAQGILPIFIESLWRDTDRFICVVTADEKEALSLYEMTGAQDMRSAFLPSRETFFGDVEASGKEFDTARLTVLSRLQKGDIDVLFASASALCQYTVDRKSFGENILTVFPSQEVSEEEILSRLVNMGYKRCDMVDGKGQFSKRGDLIDVYPANTDFPVRIEFFGDEIDTVSVFDTVSQRRIDTLKSIDVLPSCELYVDAKAKNRLCQLFDKIIKEGNTEESRAALREKERVENTVNFSKELYLSYLFEAEETALSYIDKSALFCLVDTERIYSHLDGALELLKESVENVVKSRPDLKYAKVSLSLDSPDTFFESLSSFGLVALDNLRSKSGLRFDDIFEFSSRKSVNMAQNPELFFEDVLNFYNKGYKTVIISQNSASAENLVTTLKERDIPAVLNDDTQDISCVVVLSAMMGQEKRFKLTQGYELVKTKFVLLFDTVQDASLPSSRRHRTKYKASSKERIMSYSDLAVGDYVVHINHGIGIYDGIKSIVTDGVQKDYLVLKYAQGDVLYVPCNSLDSVSKYIGAGEGASVKINRLSSSDWQKTKSRAKAAAKDIAKELIRLYSERRNMKGHAFSPDTPWQSEFEGAFGYEETDGQLDAVEEIKRDMESEVPMDRLLCGDVGFGKTEVALRGVFKCVMDSMQAAILAPTTVLAWQHYHTLLSRFRGFPVNIAMMSRFSTPKQIKQTLEGIRDGSVDIVVGTHRILQKDVQFKRLGFLVVDEEQRFGVTHKEKLKEMSKGVDVLTLTATPIPRTLNMALSGIRDMSILEEAPGDRFPVQTYVMEFDENAVYEAIRREVRRGGQVFYLLNNTEALEGRAKRIMDNVDGITVACAHGKMDKEELSEIWRDMYDAKIDVLVCTTIIETGVDVPNANTLIIENADCYGLSQLHQIRGRVGRSNRRAFAYLTYRRGKEISELAEKRLSAIREYTEFGSGFKIAMRDLEIRGAGNILGSQQHGHMESVGYDLYIRLLDDAVREEKGESVEEVKEELPSIDITLDAYIPKSYISSEKLRIEAYKKISEVTDEESEWDLVDELCDRYGDVPKSVMNLLAVAKLRPVLKKCGIKKAVQNQERIYIYTSPEHNRFCQALVMLWQGKLSLCSATSPYLIFTPDKKKVLEEFTALVGEYEKILEKTSI